MNSIKRRVRAGIEVYIYGEGETVAEATQDAMQKMRRLRVVDHEGKLVHVVSGPEAKSFGIPE